MTAITVKNIILNDLLKLLSEKKGVSISHYLSSIGIENSKLKKIYEAKLKQEGYVSLVALSFGKSMAIITPKGRNFINTGGYGKKPTKRISAKGKNETASQRLNSILSELKTKMGLIADEELILIVAPIMPIYENVFGKDSNEAGLCRAKTKSLQRCRKEILPFLIETITRLELTQNLNELNLHPKIKKAVSDLFNDGHFRQSVFDAFTVLENEIRNTTKSEKIGKELMEETFSPNNPKLELSTTKAEQQGILFLFSGSVMAIRNRYGHKSMQLTSKEFTVDLLHFASALMRMVEDKSCY